jgi:hypothetical protein
MDMAQDGIKANNGGHNCSSKIYHKLHHKNEVKPKDHHLEDSPIFHRNRDRFLGLSFWDIQLYIWGNSREMYQRLDREKWRDE